MSTTPEADLPELDDLLTTKPSSTEPSNDSDDLPDLDDLLAEAKAEQREARELKEARERRKRGGALSEEDLARLREWEAKHEWRDVSNTALFNKYHCKGCGRNQTTFSRLMRHQEHRHLRNTERWTTVQDIDPDLPNEVAVQKWTVGMCTNCCHQAGFEFRNLKEWSD